MYIEKRNALVEELSEASDPILVPIARFFDGNDDLGSIGCNLPEHPGIEAFQKTFAALAQRSDVSAIYAQIAEVDPGEGCWPFADTVFVFGDIREEELSRLLAPLQPDEVGPVASFDVSPAVKSKHPKPVLLAWWD